MQVPPHCWSALRIFAPIIGQLGEPLPICGHFQPEPPIILPMAIGRHFAGLFGMPAVFIGRGHHTILPAIVFTRKEVARRPEMSRPVRRPMSRSPTGLPRRRLVRRRAGVAARSDLFDRYRGGRPSMSHALFAPRASLRADQPEPADKARTKEAATVMFSYRHRATPRLYPSRTHPCPAVGSAFRGTAVAAVKKWRSLPSAPSFCCGAS
jgi:hypothetical protein